MRVVVIDDDEDTRELLGFALRQRGASVETCANGADALDELCASTVDVVLCDLTLPDMHGRDLLARARAAGCSALFYGLSGRRPQESDAFDHFWLKPVDINALLNALAATQSPPIEIET